MGRWAYYDPDQFERFLGGRWFQGEQFFPTRDMAKDMAAQVRKKFRVKCRTVVIPASGGLLGYDERYLVMLPTHGPPHHSSVSHEWLRVMGQAANWLRDQAIKAEKESVI